MKLLKVKYDPEVNDLFAITNNNQQIDISDTGRSVFLCKANNRTSPFVSTLVRFKETYLADDVKNGMAYNIEDLSQVYLITEYK